MKSDGKLINLRCNLYRLNQTDKEFHGSNYSFKYRLKVVFLFIFFNLYFFPLVF